MWTFIYKCKLSGNFGACKENFYDIPSPKFENLESKIKNPILEMTLNQWKGRMEPIPKHRIFYYL